MKNSLFLCLDYILLSSHWHIFSERCAATVAVQLNAD